MNINAICTIEDCSRSHYARGWCHKHYMRWRKHGSPLITKYILGNPEQRFLSYVDKSGDCWLWTGAKDSSGYGHFKFNNRNTRCTHYALFLSLGRWPTQEVLHSCDNAACVKPQHLREGTHAENMKEAVSRGRYRRGSERKDTKLVEADIPKIRQMIADRQPRSQVAEHFGVSPSTIRQILIGTSWTHV